MVEAVEVLRIGSVLRCIGTRSKDLETDFDTAPALSLSLAASPSSAASSSIPSQDVMEIDRLTIACVCRQRLHDKKDKAAKNVVKRAKKEK